MANPRFVIAFVFLDMQILGQILEISGWNGGGDVEEIYAWALGAVGLKPRNARKEKAGYVCETDVGLVVVRKARTTREGLIFSHYVKEGLYRAGLTEVDRVFVTEENMPFAERNGELYVVSAYTPGSEAVFNDHSQLKSIVRTVGRMHRITSSPDFFATYDTAKPRKSEYTVFMSDADFMKQRVQMRSYKKAVSRSNRLSDFDVLFLKYFESYERRASMSMELATGSVQLLSGESFSHNMLKEETLLICDGRVFITSFEDSTGDSFLHDLASVIKRHMRAGGLRLPLQEILSLYQIENPLGEVEIRALSAILLMPDKFYKTCVKYYSRKRNWTPASFNGVMEDMNDRREADERYLSDLENLLKTGF